MCAKGWNPPRGKNNSHALPLPPRLKLIPGDKETSASQLFLQMTFEAY